MVLSKIASLVPTVSPAPTGSVVLPVWLLTMFFAFSIMLFFVALGQRHPSRHRLLNWATLAFFVAAMVAAGQTHLVTNLIKGLEHVLVAGLKTISTIFSSTDLSEFTTATLAFIILLWCLWKYRKSLIEEEVGLQVGMGFVISLLMIFLSQSSQLARQVTSWLIDFAVGGIMAGAMSLMGGGAVQVSASDSRAAVSVPTWFALTVFSLMALLFFLAMNLKREVKKPSLLWWALGSSTVAILSASQSPIVQDMAAGFQNIVSATINGLSKANIQATSFWVAAGFITFFFVVYSATRSSFVTNRVKKPKTLGLIRLGSMVAIPLLLLILVQTSPLASQISAGLISLSKVLMQVVIGFAEVV